jgi:hypothetical protein
MLMALAWRWDVQFWHPAHLMAQSRCRHCLCCQVNHGGTVNLGVQYLHWSILKALGYTSKCIEAVPVQDRTWINGVPTSHSDHQAKSPPHFIISAAWKMLNETMLAAMLHRHFVLYETSASRWILSLRMRYVDKIWRKLWCYGKVSCVSGLMWLSFVVFLQLLPTKRSSSCLI